MTSDRAPIVWIINEGGHDYADAERFGRPMAMTTGSINPFSPDRLMVVLSSRIRQAHEDDHIVVGGSPMLNGIAIAMWLTRFKKMNCLIWSHRNNKYEPITISAEAVARNAMNEGKPAP